MKKKLILLLLSSILMMGCDVDAEKDFIEVNGNVYLSGAHYILLADRLKVNNYPAANVIEFFWYGCPHCQAFEGDLQLWLDQLPAGNQFGRVPAIWNDMMVLHARAYFSAIELDVLPSIHESLFVKIIAMRKVIDPIVQRERITELFQHHGIPRQEFSKVFDSEKITAKVKSGIVLSRAAEIISTPSFLVNGKYVLTGSSFKNRNELLSVADALMQREIDGQLVDWW